MSRADRFRDTPAFIAAATTIGARVLSLGAHGEGAGHGEGKGDARSMRVRHPTRAQIREVIQCGRPVYRHVAVDSRLWLILLAWGRHVSPRVRGCFVKEDVVTPVPQVMDTLLQGSSAVRQRPLRPTMIEIVL